MVVQTAALLICYEYEIPLQKRLRRLLVQDRRLAERRRSHAGVMSDRRRTDRRARPQVDVERKLASYASVTLP